MSCGSHSLGDVLTSKMSCRLPDDISRSYIYHITEKETTAVYIGLPRWEDED